MIGDRTPIGHRTLAAPPWAASSQRAEVPAASQQRLPTADHHPVPRYAGITAGVIDNYRTQLDELTKLLGQSH
jgi:hypothetical protein